MNSARHAAAFILVGVLSLAGTTRPARGEGSGGRALDGVWAMTLTLRDCTTQAPLGPPFRSLVTFHRGGTLTETLGSTQFAPGQRSTGHGVWSRTGPDTFQARFVAMILFDTPAVPPAPGFQAGWLVVQSTFTADGANRQNIAARAHFSDLGGVVYRSACPTGTAERFR